jgi:hypothetical protein
MYQQAVVVVVLKVLRQRVAYGIHNLRADAFERVARRRGLYKRVYSRTGRAVRYCVFVVRVRPVYIPGQPLDVQPRVVSY